MHQDEHTPFLFIRKDPFELAFAKRAKDAEKGNQPLVLLIVLLVTYLPVLLITIMEGTFNKNVTISFIRDFGVQFRFLAAVPLLVLSRVMVQQATSITSKYIHDVLLRKEERDTVLLPAIAKIRKLNESWISVTVIVSFVVILTAYLFYFNVHDPALVSISGWYGSIQNGEFETSNAYLWYNLVSMSIFRFLMARWLWTYCTWVWLLYRVSKCPLKLTPHHSDKACGLNMLVFPQTRFNLFFVALALTSSGSFINDLLYRGAVFEEIIQLMIVLVAFSFILLLGPYYFFMPKLFAAIRKSQVDMSRKSHQLGEDYDEEWIQTSVRGSEDEKPDPSVMIDFYSTYEVTEKIRPFAFSARNLITLAVPIALAFVPTVLTKMSLKELIQIAMGFVV